MLIIWCGPSDDWPLSFLALHQATNASASARATEVKTLRSVAEDQGCLTGVQWRRNGHAAPKVALPDHSNSPPENATAQRSNPQPELDPVIEAYKRDIDRTLLRENLKLSVTERFEQAMQLQRFAEELRRAGAKIRNRHRSGSVDAP